MVSVIALSSESLLDLLDHLFADLLRLELRRTLPGDVPGLHRRAAGWFTLQGQVVDAIRHTQAAGDWPEAARLLADHSFSLTLDGQAQTIQALVRAFPPGTDHPELALVRAMADVVQGRLDEAAAYLAVAETYAETAPPDRQRRLRVAIASLKLSLARRRGHLAGVIEQVRFLASPVTGQSDEDIALDRDLRAVALMNLGTVEAWSLGLPDAERHLREGAVLAREIGRPYLEVGCLAQLGFAYIFHGAAMPKIHPFAMTQAPCREAIALAERYGWGAEPVIAPALMTLAGTMVWLGEFDEGERWLRRTERALQTDTGPDIRLLLHQTAGMLHACRGRRHELLEALPRHETAHAALLADILDVLHGTPRCSPTSSTSCTAHPRRPKSSPHRRRRRSSARASSGCCDISRRTCPGRRSQANYPSRRARSARTSAASTPSSRFVTGPRPCSVQGSCGCWPLAARASTTVT